MQRKSKAIISVFSILTSLSLSGQIALGYQDPAFDQGRDRMAAGDYDGAVAAFGESLGLNSDNPRAFVLRGECFFKMGNYKLAIQDLTTALEYSPNNIRALLLRGTSHSNLGKDGMAVVDYMKAIQMSPKLADKFFNSTTGGGVPALKEMEKLSANDPIAAKAAAADDDGSGDDDSGLNVHAIKDYQEAMRRVYPDRIAQSGAPSSNSASGTSGAADEKGAAAADPANTSALVAANKIGNPKESADPGNKLSPIFKDAQNNAGLESNDTIAKAANERFTANLDQDPNRGEFGLIAGAGEFQGDAKQAVLDYSQGLKMDPTNAEYYYKRGKAFQKLGKVNDAMGDFNHAILQDPQQGKYYIGRASLYFQLGRTVLMDADIVAARNCNPDLPAEIHFNLTKLPAGTQWAGDGPRY